MLRNHYSNIYKKDTLHLLNSNYCNTDYNNSDPLIAPDESYLIFHSGRPHGFGEHDLYISLKWNMERSEKHGKGH